MKSIAEYALIVQSKILTLMVSIVLFAHILNITILQLTLAIPVQLDTIIIRLKWPVSVPKTTLTPPLKDAYNVIYQITLI